MPGWHEATTEAQQSGRLGVVGIVQEQHPERARLFMQWKQMPWPLLVDSLNLYRVTRVPITLLLDEWGIIRNTEPTVEDLQTFLETEHAPPDELAAPPTWSDDGGDAEGAARDPRAEGDRLFLTAQAGALQGQGWDGEDRPLSRAIDRYEAAIGAGPDDADAHFRLGVATRARFDSEARRAGDFERAVEHWSKALELNPNQYIWRRRIQQYGPRLDKPYAFYDWVTEARREIEARGEKPVELPVEPGGAELAAPAREIDRADVEAAEPDPDARITDGGALVTVESIAVPNTAEAGSYRVHLLFQPERSRAAHWNNEAGVMQVWVEAPTGWRIDRQLTTLPNARSAVSSEVRQVEVEIARAGAEAAGGGVLRGHALFYICEGADGVCLYRRKDFQVALE